VQLHLAKCLRNWRIWRRLSQEEAGQSFGVSGSTIANWERRGVPRHRTKLAGALLSRESADCGVSFKTTDFTPLDPEEA
jgi:transcriptional regulator with XRE-family HTH domain